MLVLNDFIVVTKTGNATNHQQTTTNHQQTTTNHHQTTINDQINIFRIPVI